MWLYLFCIYGHKHDAYVCNDEIQLLFLSFSLLYKWDTQVITLYADNVLDYTDQVRLFENDLSTWQMFFGGQPR